VRSSGPGPFSALSDQPFRFVTFIVTSQPTTTTTTRAAREICFVEKF